MEEQRPGFLPAVGVRTPDVIPAKAGIQRGRGRGLPPRSLNSRWTYTAAPRIPTRRHTSRNTIPISGAAYWNHSGAPPPSFRRKPESRGAGGGASHLAHRQLPVDIYRRTPNPHTRRHTSRNTIPISGALYWNHNGEPPPSFRRKPESRGAGGGASHLAHHQLPVDIYRRTPNPHTRRHTSRNRTPISGAEYWNHSGAPPPWHAAQDLAPPGVGHQDPRYDLHRRGLARAVRPDVPNQLPRLDLERHAVQGAHSAVTPPGDTPQRAQYPRAPLGDPKGLHQVLYHDLRQRSPPIAYPLISVVTGQSLIVEFRSQAFGRLPCR